MENLDVRTIIPMLQQFGISPDQLSIERLDALMKLADSIKNPSDITPEMSKKILDTIGINTNPPVKNTKNSVERINPNSICSCSSGKKYKKCCGKNDVVKTI
jgi:hypothetical protein